MKVRLHGIDFLRVLSIFAIVHFHVLESMFFSDTILSKFKIWPHTWEESYSRALSFSGFTIVFIFYFLHGYKKTKETTKAKILVLSFGLLFLSSICWYIFGSDFLLEWDIYHFLIVTYLLFKIFSPFMRFRWQEFIILYLLALIPFWHLENLGLQSNILIGNCSSGSGMWPLFPTIFLVFMAYSLGGVVAKNQINRTGAAVAVVALGIAFLSFSDFYYFRYAFAGPGFGCHMHRPPFLVWWALMTGFCLLFFGLAQEKINRLLEGAFSDRISNWAWNKSFGYCYLTQWIFIAILYTKRSFFIDQPEFFFLAPLVVILATEYTVRGVVKALK